jgi:hypothetical protein
MQDPGVTYGHGVHEYTLWSIHQEAVMSKHKFMSIKQLREMVTIEEHDLDISFALMTDTCPLGWHETEQSVLPADTNVDSVIDNVIRK